MKALIAAGALALSAGAAQAQGVCFDHADIATSLAQDGLTLHAAPIVTGPSIAGLTEIYVAQDGRWIMIVLGPDGAACVVFVGERWHLGEAT